MLDITVFSVPIGCQQFCKDATDGPDVNRTSVVGAVEHQFWRAIVPCHNVTSQPAIVCSAFPCQPKVQDLDIQVTRDCYVCRLQIPVPLVHSVVCVTGVHG
jgi:hypothetical protein